MGVKIVCYLAASAIIIIVIIIFVTLCTLLGFFFLFCLFCLVFVYIVLYYCMLPLEVNKVVQLKNGLCDTDHAPYGWIVILRLGYDIAYLRTKFDDSSYSQSKDIIGAAKFSMRHVTMITPLLKVICPPYTGTLCSLPVYKII